MEMTGFSFANCKEIEAFNADFDDPAIKIIQPKYKLMQAKFLNARENGTS